MSKVSMSTRLPVSAAKVWALIGGFNALPDWHPSIESSKLSEDGQTRTLTLLGGGKIVETLEHASDAEWTYSYAIIDSPLPVGNYKAMIKLTEDKNGTCSISWSSDFEAVGAPERQAVQVIQGIYQQGFDNLKKMFGG
jgi:hypothetical protein